MKHKILLTVATVALATSAFIVQAADNVAPAQAAATAAPQAGKEKVKGEMHRGAAKTRQEAIARAKERVKKLESMSDEEWKAQQEKRKARKKQAKNMTPEEREKLKEKFKAAHEKKAQ